MKPAEITPEFGEVRAEEEFDRPRLHAYLRGKIPGADHAMEVMQFKGGHSNLTYLLRFGEKEWVVRRPPFGPLPKGGHDMAREYKVLSRLWKVFAPAPRAVLFSDDPSILGAPFFVMERRKGILISNRQPLPPILGKNPETFRAISEGFIDTLADLHAVDYHAVGLDDLGRPEGFLRRQTVGWMERWERAKTREIVRMNKLGAWFLEHMPPSPAPTLIHNDFYLHNLMLDFDNPGRVAGLFDWEMSTIGDPLLDLGVAMGYWREKTDPEDLLETSQGAAHTLAPGFLSRREMVDRYAKRTGRDLGNFDFYWAWAHWKNATVVEQIYVRYVRGQTTDPRFLAMGTHAPALAHAAAVVAGRVGFKE